jgi:hypothetical protein
MTMLRFARARGVTLMTPDRRFDAAGRILTRVRYKAVAFLGPLGICDR